MVGLRLSCAVPAAFDTFERFAAELTPNLVLSACLGCSDLAERISRGHCRGHRREQSLAG